MKSLCKQFPEISDVWLDTGLGEMRTDGTYYDEISYPRVPMYVEAGRLTEFCGSITMVQCEKFSRITQFHQYDFTIIVNGDSMYPLFMKGDELACKMVESLDTMKMEKIYVLDTTDGSVVKRVYPDGEDSFRCVSLNPTYRDFTINRKNIFSASLVVGMIRNSDIF